MTGNQLATDEEETTVEWRRRDGEAIRAPLVNRVRYVECKLEHPDLDPTSVGGQFFPDAVPYELGDTERVFYWRSALTDDSDPGTDWQVACATTHALAGVDALPQRPPAMTDGDEPGVSLVVDGTVGGDTTTARVESYNVPTVELTAVSATALGLRIDGREEQVAAGERRRIALDERSVRPLGEGSESTTITPELVVRYPGRRELHHPAPDSSYRLFPSFGLDLGEVPRPLAVPTTAGELDDGALAEQLGVDLAERPYPERVLWQAFAYTAFDPHRDSVPELAQARTGHLVLSNPPGNGTAESGVTGRFQVDSSSFGDPSSSDG